MPGFCRRCGNWTQEYMSNGICSGCEADLDNAQFVHENPGTAGAIAGLFGIIGLIIGAVAGYKVSGALGAIIGGLVLGIMGFGISASHAKGIVGAVIVVVVLYMCHLGGCF